MQFYRATTEAYLLIHIVVSPVLCIFVWLLLGKILNRRLHAYARWYVPQAVAATLTTSAVLLEAFVRFYAPRDYALAALVYLLTLASLPFHLISFIRFWQLISRLPADAGQQPQPVEQSAVEQGADVWPPPPRR